MKRSVLVITSLICLVLVPSVVLGSPFLVCDPQSGVTQYIAEVNGVESEPFAAETDGSAKFDLSGLSPGQYTFRLRCATPENLWSDFSVPFVATKPVKPGGVKVVP